jgi:hypothetical protein
MGKLLKILALIVAAGWAAGRLVRSADEPSKRGPGVGWPSADTGKPILDWINDFLNTVIHIERRFDPFYRPAFEALFRDAIAEVVTDLINSQRTDEGYRLAEEREQPDEEAHLRDIIDTFAAEMRQNWNPGYFERGGNTKTHGVVRAQFTIRNDLPPHMRRGIFGEPRTCKAWVRFSGPGPYDSADIDDIGFMSMAIKLMGVAGPKLMDDEQFTQDLLGTSVPTFVSPDTRSNAQIHHWSLKKAPVFYFFDPKQTHILDSIMNSLWTKTQSSPLESEYFSTVAYLLGEGQAMQYSFHTRLKSRTPVPNLPFRPPRNYLREAMAATLAKHDVEFDICAQLQTDPFLMPIENAAVMWPPKLSPRVPVAVLRIPRQTFDSPEQLAFARVLTYNPWHSIPEHRPLGNVSRARNRMYWELSQLRLRMNNLQQVEPTGDETFPGSAP